MKWQLSDSVAHTGFTSDSLAYTSFGSDCVIYTGPGSDSVAYIRSGSSRGSEFQEARQEKGITLEQYLRASGVRLHDFASSLGS